MTKEQLDEVLKRHKMWLKNEPGGERANLCGAILWEADLRGANLRGANLWGANLWGANLWGTNLWGANLRETILRRANLQETILRGANLQEADLRKADLRGANLQEADLREVDLRGANLCGAILHRVNIQGAKLQKATGIPNYICPICCPEEGSFIGFKKANAPDFVNHVIVKLEISADAKRSSATTRKCRCSKAKVLSITDLQGKEELQQAYSTYDNHFIYEVGKIVEVDNFDDDRWDECSTGIHFFITRDEAVRY